MFISFDLPGDIEDELRQQLGDLSVVARDAFIIENYRMGRISLGAVAQLVGLATTIQAQEWLGVHKVPLNYTIEDLEADQRALDKLLGEQN